MRLGRLEIDPSRTYSFDLSSIQNRQEYHQQLEGYKLRLDNPVLRAYSQEEVDRKVAVAELSVGQSIARRVFLGFEEVYGAVERRDITLPAGYLAIKVLVEATMPFADPESKQTMSDVLAGWRRQVLALETEQAEQAARNEIVEQPESLSSDAW